MKPIIGILGEIDSEKSTRILISYVNAIECSGGFPLLLPYVTEASTRDRFVELCDGFLFTGGEDIDPKYYGETPKATCGAIQPLRDELEFGVLERVLPTGKPIMAICRGAQLVNVALGGTLYQDLPSERPGPISHKQTEPRFAPSHEVQILENTPLYALISSKRMTANSFHHQAVKALGADLEPMALADDGVVEAFCLRGARYLRAYQWHPERLFEIDACNRSLFGDFIIACQS
ncbi:MAG: gamma-glutamyl-gamma-aminobutyrate hydrolase family protein [Clostridia bacterium]|nr:gamma-glutamyl-gamma-aminobutyrate hydrolase family protein [Clostridia bacterium]